MRQADAPTTGSPRSRRADRLTLNNKTRRQSNAKHAPRPGKIPKPASNSAASPGRAPPSNVCLLSRVRGLRLSVDFAHTRLRKRFIDRQTMPAERAIKEPRQPLRAGGQRRIRLTRATSGRRRRQFLHNAQARPNMSKRQPVLLRDFPHFKPIGEMTALSIPPPECSITQLSQLKTKASPPPPNI